MNLETWTWLTCIAHILYSLPDLKLGQHRTFGTSWGLKQSTKSLHGLPHPSQAELLQLANAAHPCLIHQEVQIPNFNWMDSWSQYMLFFVETWGTSPVGIIPPLTATSCAALPNGSDPGGLQPSSVQSHPGSPKLTVLLVGFETMNSFLPPVRSVVHWWRFFLFPTCFRHFLSWSLHVHKVYSCCLLFLPLVFARISSECQTMSNN